MPIKLDEVVPNYDDTLAGRLLHYVENPDSVGYKKGNWYSPKYDKRYDSKKKNYDINNFGMGVDRNTNQYVKDGSLKFHKDKQGREYLTEAEERNARNHSIAEAEKSYNNRLAYTQKKYKSDVVPSEMKKALTMSAIYNLGSGKVANELFEDDALMRALLNGTDKEYSDRVNYFYDLNNKANRSERTTQFLDQYIKEQEAAKKKKKDDGGFLNPKSWNDLSLTEKADMMKIAVSKGIYNLDDIKSAYNSYAQGGLMLLDYI